MAAKKGAKKAPLKIAKPLHTPEIHDEIERLTKTYTEEVKRLGEHCGIIIDVKVLISLNQQES